MDFSAMSKASKTYFEKTSNLSPYEFFHLFNDNSTPEWSSHDFNPQHDIFEEMVKNSENFRVNKRKREEESFERVVRQKPNQSELKRKAYYDPSDDGPISFEARL